MVALFHSFIAGKALDNFLALLEQFGILLFASVFQTKEIVDVRGHINYLFYLNTVAKRRKNE
jgi:hypothetical protein